MLRALIVVATFVAVVTDARAGNPLSGPALESACQAYADRAVKLGAEWKQLGCQKLLDVAPQLLHTDAQDHLNRCRGSVGTSIEADLQSMEDYLRQCRGSTHPQPPQPPPPPPPPSPRPPPPPPPGPDGNVAAGEGAVWDMVVINSTNMARSTHAFRIAGLSGKFVATNLISGGPSFSGEVNGTAFEAVMTDSAGYEARFFGRVARSGRVEGTGCDNRRRGFSFTLGRRR